MDHSADETSTPAETGIEISLDETVREEIYDHIFSSPDAEVAGVLVGPSKEDGPIQVTGRIEARDADNQMASVTFTHESWSSIYEQLETNFEGQAIVGWYHSHPGFGIFLSDHDLFIHHNFFPGERQIAYVVDPLAASEGFFVWEDGEVEKLVERPASRASVARKSAEGESLPPGANARTRRIVGALAVLLVGALIGVAAGLIVTSGSKADQSQRDAGVIAALRQELETAREKVGALMAGESDVNVSPGSQGSGETRSYVVKQNENLSLIAKRFYGSVTYTQLLAAANGISDENQIPVGLRLRIPPKSDMDQLMNRTGK